MRRLDLKYVIHSGKIPAMKRVKSPIWRFTSHSRSGEAARNKDPLPAASRQHLQGTVPRVLHAIEIPGVGKIHQKLGDVLDNPRIVPIRKEGEIPLHPLVEGPAQRMFRRDSCFGGHENPLSVWHQGSGSPAAPFAPACIRSCELGRPRTRPPPKPIGGLRHLGLTTPTSPRS